LPFPRLPHPLRPLRPLQFHLLLFLQNSPSSPTLDRRNNIAARDYDYRFIQARLENLAAARRAAETTGSAAAIVPVINIVRSGLVRNLGNITSAKLYNQSFAGTKYLIEEYVTQVAEAIRDVCELPAGGVEGAGGVEFGTGVSSGMEMMIEGEGEGPRWRLQASSFSSSSSSLSLSRPSSAHHHHHHHYEQDLHHPNWEAYHYSPPSAISAQVKLDFVHNARQAFGRTTLVLQGGSIFGMCHLGVVKALHLRGLLPRIITGTATGALIAAFVAIHTDEELPEVLRGDGIDLSAFAIARAREDDNVKDASLLRITWATLVRRLSRFRREGYLLDVRVLEECVRANIGDLTFDEAYRRSKRVLNITVATETADGRGTGVPTLLNYLTAPNVLVWSAALASNAAPGLYGQHTTPVLCKDAAGNVVPWAPASTVVFRPWTQADRYTPLTRVAHLFNVNHFIVSQARPYLVPFLQGDMHGPSVLEARSKLRQWTSFFMRLFGLELRHRLRQLDTLQLLPPTIRRFLVDEAVPGATASMTIVPEVSARDFARLLETPTHDTLEYWIQKGERSVWPAIAALRVRCAVEAELERSYHATRRLRPNVLPDIN
jgi:TAG lipase/lysophosphatidylethanolamine acyltransferase